MFVTDGFHLAQSGRSEPILNYQDLKTNKLVIFNYDKCNPIEEELFTSVREFLKDKNIKCLVLSLHHIVDERDLPKDFDYSSFDFFVFEAVNSYSDWKDTFDIFTNTIQYLRPKKFLSFNNAPHAHRIELKKFLTTNSYSKVIL